jgi:hypothetical protein
MPRAPEYGVARSYVVPITSVVADDSSTVNGPA